MTLDGSFGGPRHRLRESTPRTEAESALTWALVATCEEHGWPLSVRPRSCVRGVVLTVRDPHQDSRGILARGRGRTLDEAAAACLSMLVARGHAARVGPPRSAEDAAWAGGFPGRLAEKPRPGLLGRLPRRRG